ncbi:MAG TPA: hypothetical protein EYP08_07890, partial [Pyrodictiaceae archaeon]|nr:hypothetical protein [Pyrodictiaceae archaeon]HIP85524.1 hypothetical protein [Pyrodictium sp.]HIQ10945.1 hypothetical protein [Pyrodictium sp.]HIQ56277.1 hypothetical protein [Pyrodictium sp.]
MTVKERIIGSKEFYERVSKIVEILGFSRVVASRSLCIVEKELMSMAESLNYCSNIIVSSSQYFMLTELVVKLYKLSQRRIREILVGVDTGVSMAYAVIVDGVLLDWGQLHNLNHFIDELHNLMCVLEARKKSVKIGVNGNRYMLDVSKSQCYNLEYVDENGTNEKSLYLERIVDGFKVSKHVRSAIAIALRKGIEVKSS